MMDPSYKKDGDGRVARRDGAETGGTERRMECLGDGAGQGAVGRPLYGIFEEGAQAPISVY